MRAVDKGKALRVALDIMGDLNEFLLLVLLNFLLEGRVDYLVLG